MTTPFDMIGTKGLAPTCTAIAEAGGTSEHAEWIRRPRNAATLVAFMNEQMGGVNTLRVELYENERGTSNYAPPKGWAPKACETQHLMLRDLWSKLAPPPSVEALLAPYRKNEWEANGYRENCAPKIVLPEGAEGFFFEAKFSSILRLVQGDEGMADYNRVLKLLFSMMRERQSNFKDWTEGHISPEFERPLEDWWKRRLAYEATIQGDFVAYAGQTGIAHRNWSVRASRAHMEQRRRWVGITTLDACQVLFIHPERFTANEQLAMDCAGSERDNDNDGDGVFPGVSCFCFFARELRFGSRRVQDKSPHFGSASVLLPGGA